MIATVKITGNHGGKMSKIGLTPSEYTRSDLALEQRKAKDSDKSEYALSPFRSVNVTRQDGGENEKYVTLDFGRITELGEQELSALEKLIATELFSMAKQLLKQAPDSNTRLLIVGLGNSSMTADAVGPNVLQQVNATRHLREFKEEMYTALGCCELSCIIPGVLGQTGIESAEIVKGAAECSDPHLIIAVDALAARSPDRLASTIQLSNTGIAPGSGIGNTRVALDSNTMDCPVIAIGVPTVVDSSVLVYDALCKAGIKDCDISENLRSVLANGKSFIVSPKDADVICDITSRLIAAAINSAFGLYES
jgi:spore protease